MSDLPPLDQAQAYVVVGPNDQRGPYTMELLISEVLAGRLSEATPVWWPGLADWTTMGGHPAVMAELARRRTPAPAPEAPAWAEPAPAADPYAQPAPAADPYAQPAPAADPYAQPAPAADPYAQPAAAADPFAPAAGDDEVVEAEVVDVELVDEDGATEVVEIDEVVVLDPAHGAAFSALVARSAVRADLQARVDAVNEQLVDAVVEGVSSQGFSLGERVDVDRGAELRFDGADGDLVMVSLGRATAVRPDDLRDDHVPVTATYRSGAQVARSSEGSGVHGDVVVAADEWTGQSTSSVSLFLGLGDYLDGSLTVDRAGLAGDAAATIAVLRSKLA